MSPGRRIAHERVGVGAVVIHQAARGVHRVGDLFDVVFEEAQRVGVGHHADGGVGTDRRLDFVDRDAAARVGFQRDDVITRPSPPRPGSCRARYRARSRSGAWRAAPICLKYALAISSAVSSACAPAAGLSENAAMPNSDARLRSSSHMTASAPCANVVGRERVQIAKRRQVRHRIVDARVVLHRARAQRIEPQVDRERLLREPREMAVDVEFGVVGQRQDRRAASRAGKNVGQRGAGGQVAVRRGRGAPTRRSAECQTRAAACGTCSVRAETSASISRVRSSVRSPSSGCNRPARDRSGPGPSRRGCASAQARQVRRPRGRERARRTR